uniref:NADP-dependent oxidoreductase domain-containing protein n=1 Tax=Castor canadensis TaxID=51338 RepID=A0A8C0XE63_CASCN
MNSKHQQVKLNDGHFIPGLGFGTYTPEEVPKSKTMEATKMAIDAGFLHIDTAYVYQVEEEIGLAIRSKIIDGTVNREDMFLTSKLVQSCLERSLKKLQLDYVDLYLIHFPVSMKGRIFFQQMSMERQYQTHWIFVGDNRGRQNKKSQVIFST